MNAVRDTAIALAFKEFSVIPCHNGGEMNKTPKISAWSQFQDTPPTVEQVEQWFPQDEDDSFLAIICGTVKNVICIDIDNPDGNADLAYRRFFALVKKHIESLDIGDLVVEATPSGGYHILYCIDAPPEKGNQKLAQVLVDGKKRTIIETRSSGGYVVCAPSEGYNPISGDITKLKIIDFRQHLELIDLARSFNAVEKDQFPTNDKLLRDKGEITPANIFNASTEGLQILLRNGWTQLHSSTGEKRILLRRPGKDAGISATYGYIENKLYVFSTNAEPFEDSRTYSNFAILALLEYNSDFSKTAKHLAEKYKAQLASATKKRKKAIAEELVSETSDLPYDEPEHKPRRYDEKIELAERFLEKNYQLRYNSLLGLNELKAQGHWTTLSDRLVAQMWREMGWLTETKLNMLLKSDFIKEHNPLKEFLSSLPEFSADGESQIQRIINSVTVKESQTSLWHLYFRKWFCGLVATIDRRGINHSCLVLQGAQGVGKTRFFSRLLPDELKKYYFVPALTDSDKDLQTGLCERIIANLDELESFAKKDVAYIKSLITKEHFTIRRPYDKRATPLQRTASFCASVNQSEFLVDQTGNRRFLVVEVLSIDELNEIDYPQLYAEALFLLNNGFRYWFAPEEAAMVSASTDEYRISPPEEEMLLKYFRPATHDDDYCKKLVSTTDLINDLSTRAPHLRLSTRVLGIALRRCGFERKKVRVGKDTPYVWSVVPVLVISEAAGSLAF